ncbi:MAG: aminotransferase class V-fold PLP-dependent enzyme [Planctomycetota bacterium]|nr:aminotransferase class V-fold PLP-dependent enzyme [Planctomycetota bacterium]
MGTTRRTFLRGTMGAGAAVVFGFSDNAVNHLQAAIHRASDRSPDDLAQDEDFWFHVQRAYAVDRSLINLNNGGVSPSPRSVQDAMRRYLEYTNHAPARTLWTDLDPGVETVRRDLARHFGCDKEEMAITRNASEALEIAIFGIDLEPGDEVLSTNQDYPRMLNSWKQREQREGIVLRTVSFPTPPDDPAELARIFEKNITPKTKVLMLCHITNLTGQIFPVGTICRAARKRGIATIVDGAHAFAHFRFKHRDLDCDYYGTSLHKWLSAPIGTGFLYVRRDRIKGHWPLMAAPDPHSDDIRKFEEIGTHPAANRLAIADALRFYEGLGPARKESRLRYLKNRWARRLEGQKGVRILTSFDPAQSCGLANISIEGVDHTKLAQHLWKQHRIIVVAIIHDEFQGIRVTPNVYTSISELDVFCNAMERVIRDGLPA